MCLLAVLAALNKSRLYACQCTPPRPQALPSSAPLGWIRVDAKPVKQALATWASKWVYLFTQYLQSKVWGAVGRGQACGTGFMSQGPVAKLCLAFAAKNCKPQTLLQLLQPVSTMLAAGVGQRGRGL